MFCDELQIKVIAGKGGDGCVSFRREKFVPRGGPDGGDGGSGGDIIFKVNPHLNTLSNLANRKMYKADAGVNGQRKNMFGKNAEPLILEVPAGTIIFNEDKSQILADLNEDNTEVTIAKGGKGGLGNARFVSSTHQAPKFAETGEPGEQLDIVLELKLVADVGIIGLPSAGKSTLISVISNAKPKIAAYHFTTLIPNLGVVTMDKFGGSKGESFVVADIPGLIEGASEGKGLGHQFLKHTARTKLLVHVLDGSMDDIEENYKTINQELENFDKELAKKPQIVVINKTDLLLEEELEEKMKKLKKAAKIKTIFAISAAAHKDLPPLMFEIAKKLAEEKAKEAEEKAQEATKDEDEDKKLPVLTPHLDNLKFEIEKIIRKENQKIFRIKGKRIEQLIVMTDTKNPEGLERIYHYLNKLGIQKAIEKEGATFGDFIKINETKIPYRK